MPKHSDLHQGRKSDLEYELDAALDNGDEDLAFDLSLELDELEDGR